MEGDVAVGVGVGVGVGDDLKGTGWIVYPINKSWSGLILVLVLVLVLEGEER